MSIALYRRYRPDTFDQVIGQEHVTDPLKAALAGGRVNHAYLFSGPRGCGKTTSARILARCLNCAEGPTPTPCGECASCRDLATGGPGSLDVVEIDAASNSGVDDARDLRERAVYAPARDRYKVFILDEAHMVTPQGFNALLKLVEEPPEHVKFIFATTEPEKVIGTIRSRTHHYPFRLVPPDTMTSYLDHLCQQEGVPVGKGVLPLVVRAGGGSVRDSLSVLDQLIAGSGPDGIDYGRATALLGYTPDSLLGDIVDAFSAGDGAAVYRVVDRVIESGQDPRRFVEDLLERIRDLLVISTSPQNARAFLPQAPEDLLERLVQQSQTLGPAELSRAGDLLNAGLSEMTGATSPRLQLELICARILLPAMDGARSSVLSRVERMERRVGMQASGAVPGMPQATAGQAAMPAVEQPGAEQTEAGSQQAGQQSTPASQNAVQQGSRSGQPTSSAQQESRDSWDDLDDLADVASQAEALASGQSEPQQESQKESAPQAAPAQESSPVPQRDGGTRSEQRGEQPEPQAAAAAEAPQGQQQNRKPQPSEPQRAAVPASAPPTAEQPAQPQTAASPAGQDIDAIRRSWQAILDVVGRSAKLARAVLAGNAVPQDLQDGRLLLAFNNQGAVGAFTRGSNPQALEAAVSEVLGLTVKVDIGQVGEHVNLRMDAPASGYQSPSTHENPSGQHHQQAPRESGSRETRPPSRPTEAQIQAVVGQQAMDQEVPDREQYWQQTPEDDDQEGDQPAVDYGEPAPEPEPDPAPAGNETAEPEPARDGAAEADYSSAGSWEAESEPTSQDSWDAEPEDAGTSWGEGAVEAPAVVVPPPADIDDTPEQQDSPAEERQPAEESSAADDYDFIGAYADEDIFAGPPTSTVQEQAPQQRENPYAYVGNMGRPDSVDQPAHVDPANSWQETGQTPTADGWGEAAESDYPDFNVDEDLDVSESPEVGIPVVQRLLGGVILEEITE